jgi:hypothetical protein
MRNTAKVTGERITVTDLGTHVVASLVYDHAVRRDIAYDAKLAAERAGRRVRIVCETLFDDGSRTHLSTWETRGR